MQRLNHFTRYWDLIANSGRFKHTLPLLLGATPFNNFMTLSDWLYRETGQTDRLELQRLFKLVYQGGTSVLHLDAVLMNEMLSLDFLRALPKGRPDFASTATAKSEGGQKNIARRQSRHR
jgi:hypothetical protein